MSFTQCSTYKATLNFVSAYKNNLDGLTLAHQSARTRVSILSGQNPKTTEIIKEIQKHKDLCHAMEMAIIIIEEGKADHFLNGGAV